MNERTVILGAGPAGLMAALELARNGERPVVLEKEGEPGGLCRSFTRNGFTFDLGGHRFLTSRQDLLALVKDLLGEDLLLRERISQIWLSGKAFHYPLQLKEIQRHLPLAFQIRAFLGYLLERVRKRDTGNFEGWAVSHFGRPLYDLFFKPYTQKLWGVDPSALSSSWAGQRISIFHLWDLLLRLLGIQSRPVRTCARNYLYPRHGFGQLFRAMGKEVERLGGVIHLRAEVLQLERDLSRVTRILARRDGKIEELSCEKVISSVPLPLLLSILRPAAPDSVAALARKLRFRGLRFFNLLLDLPSVSPNTWIYVPEREYLMTRVQEPRNRSPENAPPGKSSLMLEIPSDPGDAIWEAQDETLLQRSLQALDSIGIHVREKVIGCFSTRAEFAYPVYHLTYEQDLKEILEYLEGLENLVVCGRQGLFRYVFTDTAMEMGQLAAFWALGRTKKEALLHKGCEKILQEVEKEPS